MALFPMLASSIKIDSTNNVIKFIEYNSAVPTSTLTATIPAGTYYLYGAGTESGDLGTAIAAALNAAAGTHVYTCSFRGRSSDAGGVSAYTLIVDATDEFAILTASTTFDLTLLGHPVGVDLPASGSVDELYSTLSPSPTWVSNQPAVRLDPDGVEGSRVQHRTPGGQVHTFESGVDLEVRSDPYRHVDASRSWRYLNTSDPAATFEAWWRLTTSTGAKIRLYRIDELSAGLLNQPSSSDLVGTYVLDGEAVAKLPAISPAQRSGAQVYGWTLPLREVR